MVIRTRTMALSAIGLLAAGAATGLSAAALFEPQNTPGPVSVQASGQTSEAPDSANRSPELSRHRGPQSGGRGRHHGRGRK